MNKNVYNMFSWSLIRLVSCLKTSIYVNSMVCNWHRNKVQLLMEHNVPNHLISILTGNLSPWNWHFVRSKTEMKIKLFINWKLLLGVLYSSMYLGMNMECSFIIDEIKLTSILTYCVLFWLLSWNFIGLLNAFCKDAPCMIVAVDTQVGVAWLIDFYKRVW